MSAASRQIHPTFDIQNKIINYDSCYGNQQMAPITDKTSQSLQCVQGLQSLQAYKAYKAYRACNPCKPVSPYAL